ncbi:MAG: hypothetical protein FD175_2701 [Beijerinckiaceae bacterium]|nr:MAG: hypothetical protein FD175_2701 [Beijerinckiaceae bacterium]
MTTDGRRQRRAGPISVMTSALAALAVNVSAQAADLRKKPTESPAPAAQACKETAGLSPDIFGFAAGSDVADLGSWSAGAEYGGAFGTRFGSLQSHGLKLQASTSPFPCLEVGPSLTFGAGRSNERIGQTSTISNAIGGGIEFKYKLLGRSIHGIGLTLVVEPTLARGYSRLNDPFASPAISGTGLLAGNTLKILIDSELVEDRLYGAFNVEHGLGLTRSDVNGCTTNSGSGYCRASNLNLRAALSLKVADNFYFGGEVSHQRAYDGAFLNRGLGHAWFAGPNFLWQINEKLSMNGAWASQIAGKSNGQTNSLNLEQFNRHLAKVKLGYAF